MRILYFLLAVIVCATMGCANIGSLSGGKRDITPPKLLSASPKDSLLNTRVTKLELQFDEYITVGDAQKEIEVSPILAVPPVVTSLNKHVTVKITDTLLEPNTTYRISFGKAIRDVHENNAFSGYTYTFSTGSYFDSLELRGTVTNAMTGFPDTSGIIIALYNATETDSAVIRKKPKYKATPNGKGMFVFKGLPYRTYRIYAIKDENSNMTYDGGKEMIAFIDSTVVPADSFTSNISLRLFEEIPDTAGTTADTVKADNKGGMRSRGAKPAITTADTTFTYSINIDTSNKARRTFDVTDSIKITFNKAPVIAQGLVKLTFDSGDAQRELPLRISTDTTGKIVHLNTRMKENTVYTLRFAEGFAVDTMGHRIEATRYVFRTFNDEDYGKIKLNIPVKYISSNNKKDADHLLVLMMDGKEAATYRITDSTLALNKLRPATYTFRIIVDRNRDGKWNTGDLFGKQQPEMVVPSTSSIVLKAGWDHTVDIDAAPAKKDKKTGK